MTAATTALQIPRINDQKFAANAYNSMPHIDTFDRGVDVILPEDEREAGVYYTLPHSHYRLCNGEIIISSHEHGEATHRTFVGKAGKESEGYEPCMWFPVDGKLVAVMFSSTPLMKEVKFPSKYRDDVGVIHPDLVVYGNWTEFTDEEKRGQAFVLDYKPPKSLESVPIATCVWRIPGQNNLGKCWRNCYKPAVGSHQKGPHVSYG